jgi:hypothetical protein
VNAVAQKGVRASTFERAYCGDIHSDTMNP